MTWAESLRMEGYREGYQKAYQKSLKEGEIRGMLWACRYVLKLPELSKEELDRMTMEEMQAEVDRMKAQWRDSRQLAS